MGNRMAGLFQTVSVWYIVPQLNINNDILMLSGVLYRYDRPNCHGYFMTISDILK